MPKWIKSSKCGTDHVTEQCVEAKGGRFPVTQQRR